MRIAVSVLVIATLFAASANAGALAPGRPSGVRAAQKTGPNPYLVATVGVLAVAGVAVLISGSNSALGTIAISGGQQPAIPITTSTVATSTTGTN